MSIKTPYILKDNDLIVDEIIAKYSNSRGKSGAGKDKAYVLKIKDMPSDSRPREKLLSQGPSALSAAELLAVVLGTGTVNEGILEMSSRILKEYGEQTLFGKTDANKLSGDLDIPLNKAIQIVACGELGRRFYDRKSIGLPLIRTARDVYQYVTDMYDLPKEHLRGIYLNTHHRIIHDEVISIGTINSNLVHPREVFRPGIEYGAAGIVLVHNHPSGEVTPSSADIAITEQLVLAGKMIGINIIDHVIVTRDAYQSIQVNYGQQ